MEFAQPVVLLAALAVIPFLVLAGRRRPRPIPMPTLAGIAGVRLSLRMRLLWAPHLLRALAIVLLIVAVARPRSVEAETIIPAQGIDIILALDVSGSMVGQRIGGVTRLEAALDVLAEFIESRVDDRLGLVVFSEFALAVAPPTLDHPALQQVVDAVPETFEFRNRTAIGLGISESVSLLQESQAASRIVVVLTDGRDNVEDAVRPLESARIAEALNVRVYTIGIVSPLDPTGVDDETLTRVAELTGGQYFAAATPEDLADVYEEISRLETSSVERDRFTSYTEYGPWFALAGALLVAADLLLRNSWLRRVTA